MDNEKEIKASEEQKNLFGFTESEAKKYAELKEIKPTFNLSDIKAGEAAKFKITSEKPELVVVDDEAAEGGKRNVFVINAIDKLTEMEHTLWLSSVSMRIQMYQLFAKNKNTLKGLDIIVSVREYDHPKYGKTRGYSVQIDKGFTTNN